MFRFQISSYDDPALEAEAAALLQQRLDKASRKRYPGLWKLSDRLYAHAAKGPGRESRRREYHIYGWFLLILGAFTLLLGLMEPRTLPLLGAGLFAIACGVLEFLLVRKRKPPKAPVSCRREAKSLLDGLRVRDWMAPGAAVPFDEDGMAISAGEEQARAVPRDRLRDVFETERLFLVIFDENSVILLQKRDLVEGEAGELIPFMRHLNCE